MSKARHAYEPKRCPECGLLYLHPSPAHHALSHFCSRYCWAVWYRRERQGRDAARNYLDGQDKAEIIELRRAGLDANTIAQRFNSKPNTVRGIIYRYAPELLGTGQLRSCAVCGGTFWSSRSFALYCSAYCQRRSAPAKQRQREYQQRLRAKRAGTPMPHLHPTRLQGTPIQVALQRAIERRLEYQITGYWRG